VPRLAIHLAAAIVVALVASAASGNPVPVGLPLEFGQARIEPPDISHDAAGNFVVVWTGDAPDDCGYPCFRPAIFGQRRGRGGGALGDPFIVGQASEYGPVWNARVAVAPAGNFLVTFSKTLRAVGKQPVIAAYAADGALVYQGIPSDDASTASGSGDVASLDNNAFVVVWYSDVGDVFTPDFNITARIVDADGSPVTNEFRVNEEMIGSQWWPQVDAAEDGSFVASWAQMEGEYTAIAARRFAPTGAATSGEFRVDTYAPASKAFPSLGVRNDGAFMVVWESAYQDGSIGSIFGQRYAPDDSRVGPEFAVNTYTPEWDSQPAVASLSDGGFVAAWVRYIQEETNGSITARRRGIFARTFATSGAPEGPEFPVDLGQDGGWVGIDGDPFGGFVVVWTDGTLRGQRFTRDPHCADADGNGSTTASDALVVLHGAVGTARCEPCVCDADNSGATTATDALRVLRTANGQGPTNCPACG